MSLPKRLLVAATISPFALLVGCAATVIRPAASPCSALLPGEWNNGVAPAELPAAARLPDGHDDARPWQQGFVAQTGQLEIANGRYADAIAIVGRCEARDAAVAGRRR